ncbi:MAG: N-acetyltransferase family protein [Syntrophobacteraceae bacterium]
MKMVLEPLSSDVRNAVIDIFNYYVENSFSAYPETAVPYDFFAVLLKMCSGYPSVVARDEGGSVIGFGMLRAYNAIPTFSRTAEVTYFLKPGYTGRGVGKAILDYLATRGKEQGLTSILASISSLNEGSIRFHLRNGFLECGRFRNIGVKKGAAFDVVYHQRLL